MLRSQGPKFHRHFYTICNKSVITLSTKCFILTSEGSLVDKTDLLGVYLSGTYCHKNGTRPPGCQTLDNRL